MKSIENTNNFTAGAISRANMPSSMACPLVGELFKSGPRGANRDAAIQG